MLYEVLTLREACDMWGLHRKSVLLRVWGEEHRRRKTLIRRSGPVYLIEARTMRELWGEPKYERPSYE